MILRPHQFAPVAWLSRRKRGLVVSPAGSGKTIIAAAALATVLEAKDRWAKTRIGWMANTVEQCNQARAALNQFQSIKDQCIIKVHCAAAAVDYSDCALLIVDECHHGAAAGWRAQIETCQGARWGFTATPDGEGDGGEERDAVLRELFGEERFVVDRSEVGSLVAHAKVNLLDASDYGCGAAIDEKIGKLMSRFTWHQRKALYDAEKRFGKGSPQALSASGLLATAEQEMYPRAAWLACVEVGIVGNEARNIAAIEAAEGHGDKSVLMLVNQVEHAKQFADRMGAVA